MKRPGPTVISPLVGLSLVLAVAVLTAGQGTEEEDRCGRCDQSDCPVATNCSSGFVLDQCSCCFICGRGEGEKCDHPSLGTGYRYGACGENLDCVLRTDLREQEEPEALCRCEEKNMVCGTNGETYKTICALRTAAAGTEEGEQPRLELASWGPCKMKPQITGKPESIPATLGGKVAISCEARGWPVPVIHWEAKRESGQEFILPSDYTTIAVQTRGGPERLMVSGWVQVMDIQPGDGGLYTCVAVNELGEARATANIGVYKGTEENTTEEEEEVEENDI